MNTSIKVVGELVTSLGYKVVGVEHATEMTDAEVNLENGWSVQIGNRYTCLTHFDGKVTTFHNVDSLKSLTDLMQEKIGGTRPE